MSTLFDVESLPIKREPAKKRYYLQVTLADGRVIFLWKTHSNGGCDWELVEKMGRKTPHFYKSYAGAKRQLWAYTSEYSNIVSRDVLEWDES